VSETTLANCMQWNTQCCCCCCCCYMERCDGSSRCFTH